MFQNYPRGLLVQDGVAIEPTYMAIRGGSYTVVVGIRAFDSELSLMGNTVVNVLLAQVTRFVWLP